MNLRDAQIEAVREALGWTLNPGDEYVDQMRAVLGEIVDAVMGRAMRRQGGETRQEFHRRRELITIERGRVDDPIRDRLAGVLHDTDCGWNCSGHGIVQDNVDARYGRLADVALRLLARNGRLIGTEVQR